MDASFAKESFFGKLFEDFPHAEIEINVYEISIMGNDYDPNDVGEGDLVPSSYVYIYLPTYEVKATGKNAKLLARYARHISELVTPQREVLSL